MPEKKLSTLSARSSCFCSSDIPKHIRSEDTHILLKEILIAAFEDTECQKDYLKLISNIQCACNCPSDLMSETLGVIGFDLYDKHTPGLAYWVYQQAMNIAPTHRIRNNLAYICRYHHTELQISASEVIDLLMDGVKRRDSFSLVNMALVFACMLGEKDDWLLADRMIKLIKEDSSAISSIQEWWSKLAEDFDSEGYLVLQWLKRHNKISKPLSVFQTTGIENLESSDCQIPKWIFEKYKKEG